MAALKEWYSSQELAGLPGLPGSDRRVRSFLQKNLAVTRDKSRGKGLEYAYKSLPPETQQHLSAQFVTDVLSCTSENFASAIAVTAKSGARHDLKTRGSGAITDKTARLHPTSAYQTSAQRSVGDARQAVLRAISRLEQQAGCSTRQAMLTFLTTAAAGRLTEDVASAMATLARDNRGRPSQTGVPSLRTLQNWLERAEADLPGDNLAPRLPQAEMVMQAWMVLAVQLKQRPQKPTNRMVLNDIHAQWAEFSATWVRKENAKRGAKALAPEQVKHQAALLPLPSYDQLNRFFAQKFSKLDLLKGQHLGSALRAHKFYQHRTAAGLEPFTEVHADGWNTHFTAPHPSTGEYVSYEVWHFHDVATRYTTPFSIGMSESAEVILKGLENCIRVGGVPAIWQTDSTGSVKNAKVQFDPVASLSARAGLTIVHPQTVGNSQANGIAENYNTRLDRASRALATYMHPTRMDSLAYKQVRKFTGQMVTAASRGDANAHQVARDAALRVGKGILFESKEQMVAWLEEVRVRENNQPHSALPKIVDPATGKRRHQTPQEALDEAKARGWQPVALDEDTLIEMFRPHVRQRVSRETVTSFGGQRYYHRELGQINGEEVMVAIDTMDGSRVWVKDLQGRLICEAAYVEVTGYRCRSMYEFALETRMNAQIKRLERKADAIVSRMDPARAPLEVQAIELQNAQVLPFGLPAQSLNGPAQSAPATPELTPIDPSEPTSRYADSPDFAMRIYGDQVERDEQERLEREAQDAGRDSFMDLLMREQQAQEEEERRKAI